MRSSAIGAQRLVHLWNSLAGAAGFEDLRPVNKFKDRTTAIERIWNALRRIEAPVPTETQSLQELPAAVMEAAPQETSASAIEPPEVAEPVRLEAAEQTEEQVAVVEPGAQPEQEPEPPTVDAHCGSTLGSGSKGALILDLIRRPEGASVDEIIAATEWQRHSGRRFISGRLVKRYGRTVESLKNDSGRRVYRDPDR